MATPANKPLIAQVTPATLALAQETCASLGCTLSDLVEGALQAYLAPITPTERDTMLLQGQRVAAAALNKIVVTLEKMTEAVETLVDPPTPPIATPEQLYGAVEEEVTEDVTEDLGEEETPRPGIWGRFFATRKRR